MTRTTMVSRDPPTGPQGLLTSPLRSVDEPAGAQIEGLVNGVVVPNQSPSLLPLARLLARRAARQHVRRHRGYGLLQIAIGLGLVAALLVGVLFLARHLGAGS